MNSKEEDVKRWGAERREVKRRETGRSDVFRNGGVGSSCLEVVTLPIVIFQEALATKGE